MLIENRVELPLDVERAWELLLDVEHTAACVPGVELRRVEGEELDGVARIKVGPVTVRYEGKGRLAEVDADRRSFELRMEGRELRGRGTATATMSVSVDEAPEGSAVAVVTDLKVTGRVAQFGRDMMAGVSARLLEQFAANLRASASAPAGAAGQAGTPAATEAAPGDAAPGDGEAPARPRPAAAEPISLLRAPDPRSAGLLVAVVLAIALLVSRARSR